MTLYFQTHVGWGRMETDCIVADWLRCTRRKWRNTTVCVWKHYSSVAAGISCKTHVYHARVRLMRLLMLFIAPTHRHWMTCEGGEIMKKGGCVGGNWRPDPERRFIINRDGVFWNEGGGWGGKVPKGGDEERRSRRQEGVSQGLVIVGKGEGERKSGSVRVRWTRLWMPAYLMLSAL